MLTWRLQLIFTMFRRIHRQKFKTKSLYTMTHKSTPKNFVIGLFCTKRISLVPLRAPAVRNLGGTCPRQLYGAGAYLWQNLAFVVLNKFVIKPI